MKADNIQELSPKDAQTSRIITQDIFSRSFHAFIFVLLSCSAIMGFTVSQWYETQKDLVELTEKYELNTLIRLKQVATQQAKEN